MSPQPLTLDGDVETFYVHQSYVLTFGKTSVDVWRAGGPHERLEHVAHLAHFVQPPAYHLEPIFDIDRNLIIVADQAQDKVPPSLFVFSLVDGHLIRKLELYGTLTEDHLWYADGKVVVATVGDLTTVLLCDVLGDGGVLGRATLPSRLRAREEKRVNTNGGVLLPVHVRPNGDIIATSSEAWGDKMEVLRWRGADVPNSPEPDASFELEVGIKDGDEIHPTCSVPLDRNTFLLAVYEAHGSMLQVQSACQTSIYAIDTETMTIRWHAEPIGGWVHTVRYVAALNVIVGFGRHDNGDAIQSDKFGYVVVLDPATGIQQQTETINHGVQGTAVEYGGLRQTGDSFAVVVVFADGSVCAVDLKRFLEHGFPREGERVVVSKPLPEGSRVKEVAVGGQTVIISVDDGSDSPRVVYFSLEANGYVQ